MWHGIKGRAQFQSPMVAIRDAFDDFFSGLTDFNVMIEAKLISEDDVRPYLKYWSELIAIGHPLPPGVVKKYDIQRIIRIYLDKYHNDGVVSLCKKLGDDIGIRDDDLAIISSEVNSGHWDPKAHQPKAQENHDRYLEETTAAE